MSTTASETILQSLYSGWLCYLLWLTKNGSCDKGPVPSLLHVEPWASVYLPGMLTPLCKQAIVLACWRLKHVTESLHHFTQQLPARHTSKTFLDHLSPRHIIKLSPKQKNYPAFSLATIKKCLLFYKTKLRDSLLYSKN